MAVRRFFGPVKIIDYGKFAWLQTVIPGRIVEIQIVPSRVMLDIEIFAGRCSDGGRVLPWPSPTFAPDFFERWEEALLVAGLLQVGDLAVGKPWPVVRRGVIEGCAVVLQDLVDGGPA
jgi:hypothetical protein